MKKAGFTLFNEKGKKDNSENLFEKETGKKARWGGKLTKAFLDWKKNL